MRRDKFIVIATVLGVIVILSPLWIFMINMVSVLLGGRSLSHFQFPLLSPN